MQIHRILIAVPQTAVAKLLRSHLQQWGYRIIEIATSRREAEELYKITQPHLTLIDLSDEHPEEGVAFARFVRSQKNVSPFIFLSYTPDRRLIELIKETLPAGFVSKPVNAQLLHASIVLALHKHAAQQPTGPALTLTRGDDTQIIPLKKILYLEADHIYVQVHTAEGKRILQRRSLTDLMDQLPAGDFVQTHRSFAVNIRLLSRWDNKFVYVGEHAVPLSRSRRKEVLAVLSGVAGSA
ncbi:MAG: response regulator transcription factor [Saprospiraceae bacterium]|nr:response regulator transcription factor [Lewinella sp.]